MGPRPQAVHYWQTEWLGVEVVLHHQFAWSPFLFIVVSGVARESVMPGPGKHSN